MHRDDWGLSLSQMSRNLLNRLLWRLRRARWATKHRGDSANIEESSGQLDPYSEGPTLVMVVTHTFDQTVPNAMMTARMGYCNAAESLGIPYLIVDQQNLPSVLKQIDQPLLFILGSDYRFLGSRAISAIQDTPTIVWVNPWFEGEVDFFEGHDLSPHVWAWDPNLRDRKSVV